MDDFLFYLFYFILCYFIFYFWGDWITITLFQHTYVVQQQTATIEQMEEQWKKTPKENQGQKSMHEKYNKLFFVVHVIISMYFGQSDGH